MSDYWMDLPDPPNHRQRWAGYAPTEEQEIAVAHDCNKMANEVNSKEDYPFRCMAGERVFYLDYAYGLMPGHIYSELGMDEFKISRSCEYHFDLWTKEPEDA